MERLERWFLGLVTGFSFVAAVNAVTPPPTADWNAFVDNGVNRSLHLEVRGGTITGWVCPSSIPCTPPPFCISGPTCPAAIRGFWDDSTSKVTFYRVTGRSNLGYVLPDAVQFYTGYVSTCSTAGELCLDGYYEAFAQSGGSPAKNVFGWHATLP
jgi:hypothetical protein